MAASLSSPSARPRKNSEDAVGANEERGPDSTPDIEAYLQRAYPEAEVPMELTVAAQNGWAALEAGPHSAGSWQLIGPSKATYPGVLNVIGDGDPYVAAGRVTAMALGPHCVPGDCPLYVGAAGGGLWRAKDGLAGSPRWQFVSGGFATNAIGSLVVDPNDPTGYCRPTAGRLGATGPRTAIPTTRIDASGPARDRREPEQPVPVPGRLDGGVVRSDGRLADVSYKCDPCMALSALLLRRYQES